MLCCLTRRLGANANQYLDEHLDVAVQAGHDYSELHPPQPPVSVTVVARRVAHGPANDAG